MLDSKWNPQLILIENASRKSETYSEPSETSKMELFGKIVDYISTVLGASQGCEYASHKTKQNPSAMSFLSQKIRTAVSANFM